MIEKDIQNKIMGYINSQPGCYAVKITGGMYSKGGVSDILACVKGRYVAIEVKRPGEKPTSLQEAFLAKIMCVGGRAFVATSVSEVKERLGDLLCL